MNYPNVLHRKLLYSLETVFCGVSELPSTMLLSSDLLRYQSLEQKIELEHLRSNYLTDAIHLNFIAIGYTFTCIIDISQSNLFLLRNFRQHQSKVDTVAHLYLKIINKVFISDVIKSSYFSTFHFCNSSPPNPFSIDKIKTFLIFSSVLLVNTSHCQNKMVLPFHFDFKCQVLR